VASTQNLVSVPDPNNPGTEPRNHKAVILPGYQLVAQVETHASI